MATSKRIHAVLCLAVLAAASISPAYAAQTATYVATATGGAAPSFQIAKAAVAAANAVTTAVFPEKLSGSSASQISAVLRFGLSLALPMTAAVSSYDGFVTLTGAYNTTAVSANGAVDLNATVCDTIRCNTAASVMSTAAVPANATTFSMNISSTADFASLTANSADITLVNDSAVTNANSNYLYLSSKDLNQSTVSIGCGATIQLTLTGNTAAAGATVTAPTSQHGSASIISLTACVCEINGSPTKSASITTFPIKLEAPGLTINAISVHFLKKTQATIDATPAITDANIKVSNLQPITAIAATTLTGVETKIAYAWDSNTQITNDIFTGGSGVFVFTSTNANVGTGTATSVTNLKVTTPAAKNAWDEFETYCSGNEVFVAVNCHSGARQTGGLQPQETTVGLLGTAQKAVKVSSCVASSSSRRAVYGIGASVILALSAFFL